MSRNLEIVRDMYEATNEGDAARSLGQFSEDVELIIHGGLNAGTFRGRERAISWFRDWFSSFEHGFQFDLDELTELPGDRVLAVAAFRASGRRSGADIRGQVAWLYEVRDECITRAELFATDDDARAAAERRTD
jgi:ketosteroid isomerase-like protein